MPNYRQVAWVVRDVDKAMEQWWSLLGVGPWDVRNFTNETVRDFHVDGRRVEEAFESSAPSRGSATSSSS